MIGCPKACRGSIFLTTFFYGAYLLHSLTMNGFFTRSHKEFFFVNIYPIFYFHVSLTTFSKPRPHVQVPHAHHSILFIFSASFDFILSVFRLAELKLTKVNLPTLLMYISILVLDKIIKTNIIYMVILSRFRTKIYFFFVDFYYVLFV